MSAVDDRLHTTATVEKPNNAHQYELAATRLRVVLPAYNEEQSIQLLIRRLHQTLDETPWRYDILVVDDGSTDGTVSAVRELAADYPVTLHCHEFNQGLGGAITSCLLRGIQGLHDDDIVVSMDADNTHPPQLMTRMVPMIREGYDIVIASRFQSGGRVVGLAKHREWLSWCARIVMQIILPVRGCRDYTCGFRAYRVGLLRQVAEAQRGVLVRESGFACMADLLLTLHRHGAIVGEVPLLLRYDYKRGASKMRVWRTIHRTIRMIIRHRLHSRSAPCP